MKKVLIVDDTKNIRTLLTTCLELYGYETVIAKNGFEALELFSTERIDLAFIDIKMPEISGTEVLRRIRAMGITIPVIIMTAFATVKNAIECTRLGAVAYLQKPFTADKVNNLLSELEASLGTNNGTVEEDLKTAKLLIETKELEKALCILKKVLSIDIECGEIYKLIGKVYELKGDASEAQSFYTMAKQFAK